MPNMNVCAKLYHYPSGSCSDISLKATTLWDDRGNVRESSQQGLSSGFNECLYKCHVNQSKGCLDVSV